MTEPLKPEEMRRRIDDAARDVFDRYVDRVRSLKVKDAREEVQIVAEQGIGKTTILMGIAAEYADRMHIRVSAPTHKLVDEQKEVALKALERQTGQERVPAPAPWNKQFYTVAGIPVRVILGRDQPLPDDPKKADKMCTDEGQHLAKELGISQAQICRETRCKCRYRKQFERLDKVGITICPHNYLAMPADQDIMAIPPVDVEIIDERAFPAWCGTERYEFDRIAWRRKPYGDGTDRAPHSVFDEDYRHQDYGEFRRAFMEGRFTEYVQERGDDVMRMFAAQRERTNAELSKRKQNAHKAKEDAELICEEGEIPDANGEGHRYNARYTENFTRWKQATEEVMVMNARARFYDRLAHETHDILEGRKAMAETIFPGAGDTNLDFVEMVKRAEEVAGLATDGHPSAFQAREQPYQPPAPFMPAVILIDGTASATINRVWFPNLEEVRLKSGQRHARIVQVSDNALGKTSDFVTSEKKLDELRSRTLLLMAFEAEANRRFPMALVTNEGTESKFTADDLPGGNNPFVTMGKLDWTLHFNNFRGLDHLKGHSGMVIVGRTEPGVWGVEYEARKVFGKASRPEGEGLDLHATSQDHGRTINWETVGNHHPILKYNSLGAPVYGKRKVARHPDNRIQEIVRQIRDYELEQAVDRLRIVSRDPDDEEQPERYRKGQPKVVYALTNAPIGDLKADDVLTLDQVLPRVGGVRHHLLMDGFAFTDIGSLMDMWGVSRNSVYKRLRRDDEPDGTIERPLWLGANVVMEDVKHRPEMGLVNNGTHFRPLLRIVPGLLSDVMQEKAEREGNQNRFIDPNIVLNYITTAREPRSASEEED